MIPSVNSFFFQAEAGIRDRDVTGVQTCALPIFWHRPVLPNAGGAKQRSQCAIDSLIPGQLHIRGRKHKRNFRYLGAAVRSEERRVGKECRCRWWPEEEKEKWESKSDHNIGRLGQ